MNDTALSAGELHVTRTFDAPRELVFRCMITPEHLTHFWGPVGVSTPLESITIDPRPGGVFATTMVGDEDGSEFRMEAVFVEVVEPERLVWRETGMGILNTSTFTDLGDGRTLVEIVQTNLPEELRTSESEAGFRSSLDKFEAYLATQR